MNLNDLIELGFTKTSNDHMTNFKYTNDNLVLSIVVGDYAYSNPRVNNRNFYFQVEFAIMCNNEFIDHDSFNSLNEYFDGQIFSYVPCDKLISLIKNFI